MKRSKSVDDELKENLFKLLRTNEDLFIEEFSKIPPESIKKYVDCVLVDDTILQAACYLNLKKAVEILLEHGADPQLTTPKNKKTPLEITLARGYYRVFQVLLNRDEIQIKSNDLLVELLHRISKVKEPQKRFFMLCYEVYINSKKKPDINLPNDKGVTPLEYAVRYCSQDLVLDLLKHGASLAVETGNENPDLLVEYIDASTLEKHLNQCVEVDLYYLKCNDDKESLKVSYNYKTLVPPRSPTKKKEEEKHPEEKSTTVDLNTVISHKFASNMSRLHDIVKMEEHSYFMEKQEYEIQPELEAVLCISNIPDLKHLVNHPVIRSFIFMKWRQVSWFYNVNRLRLITMFILFTLQALNFHIFNKNLSIFLVIVRFCMLFLLLFNMGFAVRKGFLKTSVLYFCLNDLPELACYLLILVLPIPLGKSLSAVIVFFFAFKLLFFLGQHTTNIQMFKVVTLNFLKFLSAYMILVFAYAISIFTLINEDFKDSQTTANNTTDIESTNSFTTLGMSMYNTFLILAGDFRVNLTQFPSIPVVTDIIFIIFIFVVPINLLNFLNGLAVADVQEVREEAQFAGTKSRIKLIATLEDDLIGNYHKLKRKTMLTIIPSIIKNKIQKFLQIKNAKMSLAKEVCLFPHVLKNYRLDVYPNQQGKIILKEDCYKRISSGFTSHFNPFLSIFYNNNNLRLDRKTTKQTLLLMKEKKEAANKVNEELRQLKNLEEQIERLKTGQKNLTQKVDTILKKLNSLSLR